VVTYENTFQEIEDAKPEIAVVTIGATEQHSTHLPIGTDFLMGGLLSRKVAEALDAYLLPVLPFSNSQEHQDFFGTVWLQPTTLRQVLMDVCRALKHHGIRKILVIESHGGNWILKPTIREINLNDTEMMVILSGPGTTVAKLTGAKIELHCTRRETALMMYAFPELVKEMPDDFQPDVGREYLDYVGMRPVAPTGVWGTPGAATPKLGKDTIDDMVGLIVDYATETFARLEEFRGKSDSK